MCSCRACCVLVALHTGLACGGRSDLNVSPADGTLNTTPTSETGGVLGIGGASASSTGGKLTTGGRVGTGGASASSTGGAVSTGCSDGTREGFVDPATYPRIAGCSGGFSVPGILMYTGPACARMAGNSSRNPRGTGCSVDDLCSVGFHVCLGASEVAYDSSTGCGEAASEAGLFFATRQGSTGCGVCTLGTTLDDSICNGASCVAGCAPTLKAANDVFGCGTLGSPMMAYCGVLNRFSNDLCSGLEGTPWDCGTDAYNEANFVTKSAPESGGVLCCAD
jgi:hypothetical protein